MEQQIIIEYCPHPGQKQFHENPARFKVLFCGRRWGKTKSGCIEFLKKVLAAPYDETVAFCVAPFYWHTKKMWREFLKICPKLLIQEVNRSEHRITLKGNRTIWFKSADNPDGLVCEGIDVLWIDEFASVLEEAWEISLRPALMDKEGCAFFTGTPKGHNWANKLFMMGQDPLQKDYASWSYSSYTNPYLNSKELDLFRETMTELAFRQEIMAEIVDDIGSVFRGVKSCISGTLEEPLSYKRYFAGCDLAKLSDFTVIIIVDQYGHVCYFERFNKLDWVFQCKRIVEACNRYKAQLLLDSTGVGDPIFDMLQRENIQVEGYKFTNASKKELIENLSILMDNHKISYPDIPVLTNELSLFGYKTSTAGNIQYNAPSGYHDDCVIGLALAVWKVTHQQRRPRPAIA